MKPNTISQIYYDFRSAYDNTPETTIDFYIKNALVLNNIKTFDDKEQLKFYIELTNKYSEALYHKKRYNPTIDFIQDKLPLIDSEIARLDADEIKDDWYYHILFVKAMALYSLYNYKKAYLMLKRLSERDPENEQIKIWRKYASYGRYKWIKNLILGSSAAFIIYPILRVGHINSFTIRLLLPSLGLVGIISFSAYEYYMKRSFRKSTSK